MNLKIIGLIITILLLNVNISLTSSLNSSSSNGNILYVGGSGPGNYTKIQNAIDDASDGDTVFVYDDSSPYYEHIKVNKRINLIGENKYTTVIDGGNKNGAIVKIKINSTSIKGFTIRNGKVGIAIEDVHSNDITNCRIVNNSDGISIWGSYNNIIHNIIQHQTDCAIIFEHDIKYNAENTISENNISYNGMGIKTIMCEWNEISYNEFFKNSGYAVRLLTCTGGGSHNIIHHNNFISNNEDGTSQGCDSYEGNYWFSYLDEEGNYWSDYNGTDANGDGIGDIPYEIDGRSDDDQFPLMNPFNHIPIIDIDGTMGENEWYVSCVTITFIDRYPNNNNNIDYVTYYRLNYGKWKVYTEPFGVCEDDMYTLYYYSMDCFGNIVGKGEIDFKIDQTPPTIEDLTAENIGCNTWLFTADVFDETSGINRVEFYVDGEFVGEVTEAPYELMYSGTFHELQVIVYDNAGNEAISSSPPPIPPTLVFGIISNPEFTEETVSFFAVAVLSYSYGFHFFLLQQLTFQNDYSGYIDEHFIFAVFEYGPCLSNYNL